MYEQNSVIGLFIWIIGLCFGSFATLAAYRIPLGETIVSGASRCPSCRRNLSAADLVPVFSWVFLGGKCRRCKAKVSARYPAIELVTGFALLAVCWEKGISVESVILMLLALALVIMAVIDFEHYYIPDRLQMAMAGLGVAYHFAANLPMEHLFLGPAAGYAFGYSLRFMMQKWKGKEGLGLGDVKFLAVAGLFLTLDTTIAFLLGAGVIGILTSLFWKLQGKGAEFPFGPALGCSLFLCLMLKNFDSWFNALIDMLVT